jgi:hypothetical protein
MTNLIPTQATTPAHSPHLISTPEEEGGGSADEEMAAALSLFPPGNRTGCLGVARWVGSL